MEIASKETVQKAVNYVAQHFATTDENGVFCQQLYDAAKVIDVEFDPDKNITVSFDVYTEERLRNGMKMVHGGASSTLIALFSVLALAADKKYWKDVNNPTDEELEGFYKDLGVTRSMDVQIIQAVPLFSNVVVKCHVLSNTKSNAFINSGIYNSSGRILVTGIHDMMKQSPAPKDPNDPHYLQAHFKGMSRL